MTKKNEIYKCDVCGNVVEVIEAGGGTPVCCGRDMKLLEEKAIEQEGNEKHVPVIEQDGSKVKVKVGSLEHPMEEKHLILLIELFSDGLVIKSVRLNPGEKPEAEFCIKKAGKLEARALCNIHGLWVS